MKTTTKRAVVTNSDSSGILESLDTQIEITQLDESNKKYVYTSGDAICTLIISKDDKINVERISRDGKLNMELSSDKLTSLVLKSENHTLKLYVRAENMDISESRISFSYSLIDLSKNLLNSLMTDIKFY